MNTYTLNISFEVETTLTSEDVRHKTDMVLQHGSIRDAFSAAGIDASNFRVSGIDEPETPVCVRGTPGCMIDSHDNSACLTLKQAGQDE